MKNATLQAALTYAATGWYVFPVWGCVGGKCLCGTTDCEKNQTQGKHPIERLAPHGKDSATREGSLIGGWFEKFPEINLGISTGVSGLVVLDVDVSDQKQGRESLALIDSELSPTLTALTGSGGLHAYYLRPPDIEPFTRIGARPGIDIIGNGYVIAPPSIHRSGRQYSWLNSSPVVRMPNILRTLKRPTPEIMLPSEAGVSPIVEGDRNNALFKLGCALRATGIDVQALRAALHLENRRRLQPPLGDDEVDHIARSVMIRVVPDRDVAAGAVVVDQIRAMAPPEAPALWLRDVASTPRKPVQFHSTGCAQLDHHLGGGFASTMLTGIVGPPSAGKTGYAASLCLALSVVLPVLYVSTELLRPELMIRFAALIKGFAWRDGIKGAHDAELLDAVRDTQIKLIGCDELDMSDPFGMIVRESLSIYHETGKMPAIAIDYVQLLARGSDDHMRNDVGKLTLQIRKMAQTLDTIILPVFSTSREFYSGKNVEALRTAGDPVAYLKAAKESGDIEFDCANLLYIDVDQSVEGQPKPARIAVARSRVGEPGFVGYRAHLASGRWVPDPLASSEFVQGGARARLVKEQVLQIDERAVLETISKNEGKNWREYRTLCGISRDRAEAAKARLLQIGALCERRVTLYDEHHRASVQHVLVIPRTSNQE